jgi:8-oxo-dGTP diphosphatase
MSSRFLDPPEWYASLPTVHVSACALLTDSEDRVLLVKPNYRPYWAVPGGIINEGESPHECAAREIAEELGLVIRPMALLVLDFAPPQGDRTRPMMNFIFDGGTVSDPAQIRLQRDELDAARFWTWDDAEAQMPQATAARIPAARLARKNQRAVYLPTTS